jgi:hypothetical protein
VVQTKSGKWENRKSFPFSLYRKRSIGVESGVADVVQVGGGVEFGLGLAVGVEAARARLITLYDR